MNALYFSATGTTRKIVTGIAEKLSENMTGKAEIKNLDFSLPEARNRMRKISPKTNSDCTDYKLCASVCPMGSIDSGDVTKITGICI